MKKSKLIVSVFLTGVMTLGLLTGCGGKNQEAISTSSNGKIKEFTAFFPTAGKEIPDNNRIKNAISQKIGAKVNEIFLTGQTGSERFGVMIADGEYPDIINGSQQLIDAGAFIPLEDKLDKYPNIKKFWSNTDWEKVRSADGHIYFIPPFGRAKDDKTTSPEGGDELFWIQKAVLEWANYPTLKTPDEYFNLIEKYKAANPTINGQPTIGFEILNYDAGYFCLENPPQFLAGYPNDGKAIIDKDTLTAKNYNSIPEAQKYFKKLNEEYNKGIIDPETFTANYDQYLSKISSGRVLGMIDQKWQFQSAESALKQQNLDERTYFGLPLSFDPNLKIHYSTIPAVNAGSGIGITVSCKDVDGVLQFINDLLSNEVEILRNWGEKDIDYKVDDKGSFYRTDEQRNNQKNQDWSNANMCPYGGFPGYAQGYLDDGINCIIASHQVGEFQATLSETDKKVLKGYGYEKWSDSLPKPEKVGDWYPIYSACDTWSSDQPEAIAMQKMDEIKKKWLPKVIISKTSEFDSNWNEYQTTLTTQADVKAYEDALTKEVRRRVELVKKNKIN